MLVFRLLSAARRTLWWSTCHSFSLARCLGTSLTKQVINTTSSRLFNEKNATKDPALLVLPTCPKYMLAVEQWNNKTNTNVSINCAIRPWAGERTAWKSNWVCSHRTLVLHIGAAFLQLAKSCRSNTAAHIFQLNKTDNLKTIIKVIWSGCKSNP